ncbi:MAG: hypothetical protein ACT443_09170 [Gemmatimonadota bacterium]
MRRIAPILVCAALAACGRKELPKLPTSFVAEALPPAVESVVFIVGDMGASLWERSPMPRRLARDVAWWARALGRDSAVAVLFLGDNIYPAGLHDPTEEEWPQDSAHLETQVRIFAGPEARRYKAFGAFIAGNHDWGNEPGAEGRHRIKNQEEFLARRRAAGTHVRLLPPDATPGPGIVDIGRQLRILLIDTAWWLLSADAAEKQRTMERLQAAMLDADGRNIVIGAHHPMRSASAHGGLTSFWKAFGVRWLLNKSGAALQDLNSLPYRDLLDRLDAIFRVTGPPLLFAGGHDHALQVLRAVDETEPRYMIVSGAGSKSSTVGHTEGMLYRSLEPGFMKLVVRKNGGIDLFVYTAPEGFLMCYVSTPDVQEQCVEAGAAEFRVKYGLTLR